MVKTKTVRATDDKHMNNDEAINATTAMTVEIQTAQTMTATETVMATMNPTVAMIVSRWK